MTDPFRFTTIGHADRTLLGPLSAGSVDRLLAGITLRHRAMMRPRVLDVGCGKGEVLLRAMQRFRALGTGVEPNPAFAAAVIERARELELSADLVLHELPVGEAPLFGAVFDLGICTGAGHAWGDTPEALAALARLVPRGGWGLFGVGYWKQKPAREYLDAFGGEESELRPLDVTVALPAASGWTVTERHESTALEWDDYELAYAMNVQRWLEANASDPDAPAFRSRIESWNGAYVRWGRETMGFVTLVMRR